MITLKSYSPPEPNTFPLTLTILHSDSRLSIEYGVSSLLGDDDLVAIDVLVGQLLGFFRCLHERLKPDAPSETGVIDRVVPSFPTYSP